MIDGDVLALAYFGGGGLGGVDDLTGAVYWIEGDLGRGSIVAERIGS